MNRTWNKIIPYDSDLNGFIEVVNSIPNTIGIIDDAAHYKHQEHIISTDIKEEDIIRGTSSKVIRAIEKATTQNPDLILITSAPCSSMINTDYQAIIDKYQGEILIEYIPLYGTKDYYYGQSITLEMIGKLLLEEQEKIPNSVNILGKVDKKQEEQIISRWIDCDTLDHLRSASRASKNIVTNISGLRLARYMEKKFDIPYEFYQYEPVFIKNSKVLLIGEQVRCNSIRNSLINCEAMVCSFFEMDQNLMESNDKKLKSETALIELLNDESFDVIIANERYNIVNTNKKWINIEE